MIRRYLISSLSLVLLLVLGAAAPVQGQDNDQFANEETRQLSQEYEQQGQRIEEIETQLPELEDQPVTNVEEIDRLEQEIADLEESRSQVAQDLIQARLRAIQDAPVTGSREKKIAQLRDKQDALTNLDSFADSALPWGSEAGQPIEDALNRVNGELADLEGPVPGEDNGSDTSGGGGPLVAILSAITGIVSFILGTLFLTLFNLLVMFAASWRGQGSASLAWQRTMRLSRIALAIGVAVLLGLLNVPFLLIVIGWIVAYFVLRRRARRAGGAGGGMGRMGSWFPRGPGGGSGGPDEWDEDRRKRNVAGAKGEARVNPILASLAQAHHCYVFANLSERGIGNIDHVLIHPAGLIVVETKSNAGEVVLDDQGNLTARGKPFSRDPFSQAQGQLDALRGRIGDVPGDYIVCLAAASDLRRAPGAPGSDKLVMLEELADAVSALPQRLSEDQVDRIADDIMGIYGAAPIASPGSPAPTGPTVGGSDPSAEEADPVDGEDVSPRQTVEEIMREHARTFGRKHGVEVTYTDEAVSALLRLYDSQKAAGYPSVRRVVDSRVGQKLSEYLSAGKVGAGEAVQVAVRNGQVAFRRVTEKVRTDGGSGEDEPPEEPPEDQVGDDSDQHCPECGEQVGATAKFCGQCGAPLEDG